MNAFKLLISLLLATTCLVGFAHAQFGQQPVPGFQSGFDRGINVGISGQPASGFPTGFNVGIFGSPASGFPTGFNTGISGNFRNVTPQTAFFRNQQTIAFNRIQNAGGAIGTVSPNGTINFVPTATFRAANVNFTTGGGASLFGNLRQRFSNTAQLRQNSLDARAAKLQNRGQALKQQNVRVQQQKAQAQKQLKVQAQKQQKVQVQRLEVRVIQEAPAANIRGY